MAKHTIEIEIEPGGIIRSEVHGILGNGCEMESNWLEVLGKVTEHRKTKDADKTRKTVIARKVYS